jgi:dTDP-4-dehydrorhamnose 3,5-epimerase
MNKRFNFNKKNFYFKQEIKRKKLKDERGFFERLYCKKEFSTILKYKNIVQINRVNTKKKGTIRGMHYQKTFKKENKIVTCIKGRIFDVIVDVRKDSKTFLKWHGTILDSKSSRSNFVPYGFAHGYQTLTNDCEIIYFHTDFYNKKKSKIINCFDQKINIFWPLKFSVISDKDKCKVFLSRKFKGI